MSGGRFVPATFGREVRQKLGRLVVAHPVVGVRPRGLRARCARGAPGRARGGERHSGHRTLTRLLAALGSDGRLARRSSPRSRPVRPTATKVTFTVGLKNEVDSFNPFLGIEAPSYEMWALTYDYMVGYSMDDMSPEPALAESWDTSDDGLTWTFNIREGVKWSDGAAVHRRGHRLHLQPDPRRRSGGDDLGVLPDPGQDGHGAGRHHGRARRCRSPTRCCRCCRSRSSPSTSGRTSARRRSRPTAPSRPTASPWSAPGPFRLVEGKAGGSTYRFEKNPDYWGGEPHVDEVVFRVFKAEDPMVQALIKGEVDFIHDISPLQVKALKGRDGHHRAQRASRRTSTRSASTPARSTPRPASRSATATRR